jgi:hypothetical protein
VTTQATSTQQLQQKVAIKSNQYSVSENTRVIDNQFNGLPGIYVKQVPAVLSLFFSFSDSLSLSLSPPPFLFLVGSQYKSLHSLVRLVFVDIRSISNTLPDTHLTPPPAGTIWSQSR